MLLLSSADFLQNCLFQRILSGTQWECQTVLDQDIVLGPKLFAKVISR